MIARLNLPSRAAARRGISGSALIVVLWALMVLTAAIVAWASWIYQDLVVAGEANLGFEARAMAHSGIAVAFNPGVSKFTPLLTHDFTPMMGYQVSIISEGGKLNINWVLQGEDPNKLAIFKKWLELRGLNIQEREILTDSLLDWVEPSDLRHLNAVKETDDYHPAHRPLLTVEEITQVGGSAPLVKTPGWRDQLTVFSQGPIDLANAPIEILRLIPNIGEPQIERFVQYRSGPDRIFGTIDDPQFKSLEEVYSFLGVSQNAQQVLGSLVTVNDATLRISSTGKSGKVVRQLDVVARKSGANPQIFYWKE